MVLFLEEIFFPMTIQEMQGGTGSSQSGVNPKIGSEQQELNL